MPKAARLDEDSVNPMQAMFHRLNPRTLNRVGALMLLGPIVAVAGLAIHPEEGVTSDVAVASIQAHKTAWALSHVLITVGFVATGVGTLGLLKAGLRVTDPTWTCRAWKAFAITTLIAVPVPIIETFVPWMDAGASPAGYDDLTPFQLPFLVVGFGGLLVSALVLGFAELRNPCPAGNKAFAVLAVLGAVAGLVGFAGHVLQIEALIVGDYGNVLVFLYAAVAGVNSLRMARGLKAEARASPA